METITFKLQNIKTKEIISPDQITFFKYGHFAFEVFTEEGRKLGTDEDFIILDSSLYLECKICGAVCGPDQLGQTNPLCPKHEEEHRQRQEFIHGGGGNDPKTGKEE